MGILVADFISLGIVYGVAFIPNMSVYIRKLLFSAALYFISVVLFFFLGYDGPGMLYLLAVTIFVVLSMDTLYGYIVLALNTLICVLFGFLIHFKLLNSALTTQYQLDVWIGVSSNLVFLSGTAVLLIPHLYKGLQSSFDEQKLLKEQLEESIEAIEHKEEKFRALVQDSFDLIAVLDEHARYTYVAPKAKKAVGISSEEFMGKSVFNYIHPEDQQQFKDSLASIKSGEQVHMNPIRFSNSDGDWVWIESMVTNMLNHPAIEGYVTNSQVVTDQITYQKELEKSLKEKETLLAEIHHRVKNNLAIITSMMQLQAMQSDKDDLKESLQIAQQRILTIATIHELLYGSENLSYIDFGDNIRQLSRSIEDIYAGSKSIDLHIDVDSVPLNINQAIPCALIVNELVTNAYKHAFNDRERGDIEIELHRQEEEIILSISDNGSGMSEDMMAKSGGSIGMTLVHLLKEQLEAEMFISSQNGTRFELRFTRADDKQDGQSFV